MSLTTLPIDRVGAWQLAAVLREAAARRGGKLPAILDAIEALAAEVVEGDGEMVLTGERRAKETDGDTPSGHEQTRPHDGNHELLTQRDAAGELGMSSKTISRWIEAGTLPHVGPKGRRRILRTDLDHLLTRSNGGRP